MARPVFSVLRGPPKETLDQLGQRFTRQSDSWAALLNEAFRNPTPAYDDAEIQRRLAALEAGGGVPGPQGPAGPTGPTGPQGPEGPAGPVDLSNIVLKTGDQTMQGPLHVQGQIESTTDGYKFPDGSVQTTAYTGLGVWHTALDIDFAGLANQSLAGDGDKTVDGKVWTKGNSANDYAAMAIINGTGLVITPKTGTSETGGTFTAPFLRIPVASIIPLFDFDMPLRLSFRIAISTTTDSQTAIGGLLRSDSGTPADVTKNHFDAGLKHYGAYGLGAYFRTVLGSTAVSSDFVKTGAPYSTNDTAHLTAPAGLGALTLASASGAWSSGWPARSSLLAISGFGNVSGVASSLTYMLYSPSLWSLYVAAHQQSGVSGWLAVVKNVKVEYFA